MWKWQSVALGGALVFADSVPVENFTLCCAAVGRIPNAAPATTPPARRSMSRLPFMAVLPLWQLCDTPRTLLQSARPGGGMALTPRDAPDRVAAVVGNEERAVLRDGDTHGSSPRVALGGHEARHEVHVFARWLVVAEGQVYDLVAGSLRAIPRAVHGDERATLVRRGERGGLVERDLQRCRVRLHQHVWNGHLV